MMGEDRDYLTQKDRDILGKAGERRDMHGVVVEASEDQSAGVCFQFLLDRIPNRRIA